MKNLKCDLILALGLLVTSSFAMSQSTGYGSDVKPASNVAVERDDFQKLTKYSAKEIPAGEVDFVNIRAWKFDGVPKIRYQVVISDYFTDVWRNYSTAYDSNGKSFPLDRIDHNVICSYRSSCTYRETVGFSIDRKYLISKQHEGLSIKIVGNGGSEVFSLPKEYIAQILEGIPEDDQLKPNSAQDKKSTKK